MTAPGIILFWTLAGSAAAGIAKFHGRRAGIPVAGCARQVLVLFTACTGVFVVAVLLDKSVWILVAGC
jgi:hypothetical protein